MRVNPYIGTNYNYILSGTQLTSISFHLNFQEHNLKFCSSQVSICVVVSAVDWQVRGPVFKPV